MKVQELMTRDVATCRPDDTCGTAAKLMWDRDCGTVPVLDGDGRLAGMITDRDICMAAWMQDCSPSALGVSSVMSKNPAVCSASDSVESAERLMRSRQIRRLPVVDAERRLIGILSLADIVRAARAAGGRVGQVIPEEVTATLADICQPRRPGEAQQRA